MLIRTNSSILKTFKKHKKKEKKRDKPIKEVLKLKKTVSMQEPLPHRKQQKQRKVNKAAAQESSILGLCIFLFSRRLL